jgi:hypothetical protein
MQITPSDEEITQGSLKVEPTDGVRVSIKAGVLSPDFVKPQTDYDRGTVDGQRQALEELSSDFHNIGNYEEYERGRIEARNKIGGIFGLNPVKPLTFTSPKG